MTSILTNIEIFESALEEHSGAMLHYLFGLCKDWQIAEDLSQELWASVHKSFKVSQYHDKPLLYRRAKQVFINYYRKTIRRPDLHFSEIAYEGIIMPEAREVDSPEEEERFFHAFWELFYPDEYDELSKRIFWFKHRYDYSMDEISERLQIPRSTAHDKLQRIKERCRQRLSSNQH